MVSMLGSLCLTRRVLLLVIAVCATACRLTTPPVIPSGSSWQLSGTINAMSSGRLAGPIAGALLTVQDGTNKGAQVASDRSGHFTFAALDGGRFTILIEAGGFVSAAPVVALTRDMQVDFGLRRTDETP
jgi:hypothetical protein